MHLRFVCPDCGDAHDDPGEAELGHRLRCHDCQVEIELAVELAAIVIVRAAA